MMHAPVERQRLFLGTEHLVRAGVRQAALDFLPRLLKQAAAVAHLGDEDSGGW